MKYLVIIPVMLAALIVAISFYLQPNDFIGCQDRPTAQSGQCSPADTIVVVSGGDTNARTDAGIALYQHGWADNLIFSGAAQDKAGPSNAAVMRSRAIANGVPAAAIHVEEEASSTQENAEKTRAIFSINRYKTVILVTSGYHQRRSAIEFGRLTGDLQIMNYPVLQDQDWSFWWWLTPRGWWLAGGELVKIVISGVQGAAS